MIFEVCAETVEACAAAREGGADRVEICSGLSEGGVTPSHGLIREAIEVSGLPVHVLVRPRGGGFHFAESEIAVMAEDIVHAKLLGSAGVVIGLLKADGKVDVETTRNLVQLARPMEVTFHRAFDTLTDLLEGLEDVIATGCDRVLTSGGCEDVVLGAEMLARLVALASGRIDVAVGGGLRVENASEVARVTAATHFHGSLRMRGARVEAVAVREMVERLRGL
jgi:copper homeostasis protein